MASTHPRTDSMMTTLDNSQLPTPPEAKFKSADINTAFKEIPLVDYSLATSNPNEFYRQLQYAFCDVGFCLISNAPGLDASFQNKVFEQAHAFFDAPEHQKLKADIRKDRHFRGASRQDRVKDLSLNVNMEAYHFGYDQPVETNPNAPLWKRVLNGSNQWPDANALPQFRPVIEEYHNRCESFGRTLGKHLCRMLGAPESYFTRYFEDVQDSTDLYRLATLNHYFPLEEVKPERRIELEKGYVRGLNAHRDDSNMISLLIQDEGGLEVLSHDGTWVDVPVIPGTVVVNIGLVLSDLTDGALQATVHRVNTLKVKKRRITAPYFLTPALDVPLLQIPHNLPRKQAVVDPAVVLSNAIADRSLRFVHRRMATMYRNAETFWPEEWKTLNELLAASQKVYLLQGKLQKSLIKHANADTDDWKARL